jgi:hypothetical protein
MQSEMIKSVWVSHQFSVKIRTNLVDLQDDFSDLRLETRKIARKCFRRASNCLLHEIVPLERRIRRVLSIECFKPIFLVIPKSSV